MKELAFHRPAGVRQGEGFFTSPGGDVVCFPSTLIETDGVSYIRFVDAQTGDEILYYDSEEWAQAPKEVMGAILGALSAGCAG